MDDHPSQLQQRMPFETVAMHLECSCDHYYFVWKSHAKVRLLVLQMKSETVLKAGKRDKRWNGNGKKVHRLCAHGHVIIVRFFVFMWQKTLLNVILIIAPMFLLWCQTVLFMSQRDRLIQMSGWHHHRVSCQLLHLLLEGLMAYMYVYVV